MQVTLGILHRNRARALKVFRRGFIGWKVRPGEAQENRNHESCERFNVQWMDGEAHGSISGLRGRC